ncbi:hypothetical protein N7497_001082 [Penicillium chrysogenum]|jgi:DNA topoisomerase-2|nr:hypothetical protein N7497_001082 [Penicillium chrysogenum]
MADNQRSIPSVVDGLKPGQCKVLYTCFRRNLKKDMKVIELAGLVSGMTAYQYDDTSVQQTIVSLAQTFVGSNNINLLAPNGNFGSRLQGGSDCASARYIYTRLSPFARRVFHTADEPLLTYNMDDGQKIEPETYMPVVPMILINGADDIATGWSSSIPSYNPEDVVSNIKRLMKGEEIVPMQPWFRGFTGEVVAIGDNRYKFCGTIKETGDKEVEIAELPIRTWTQDFKDKLEDIIKAKKVPSFIKYYRDYNTHSKVRFVIRLNEKITKSALSDGLEEKFKLSKTIATTKLVAFNPEGRITKYSTVDDILKEFYAVRLKYYERRKQHQLSELQKELEKLSNQARFVQMIINGSIVISQKKKSVLVTELKEKNFKPIAKAVEPAKLGEDEPVVEEGEEDDSCETEFLSSSYDYLLGMPMWSLTHERVERLSRQISDREMEIDALLKLSKEDIWSQDLDNFINEWRFQLEDEKRCLRKAAGLGRRESSKLATFAGARGGADSYEKPFPAPKSKKTTAKKKKEEPPNILADCFSKSLNKPKPSSVDGAGGSRDEFGFRMEVMPKKSRGASKSIPKRKEDFIDMDEEPAPDPIRLYEEPQVFRPKPVAKPAEKRRPKPKPKHIFQDSDDDFKEIARGLPKPAALSSRTRKSVKYDAPSDSDNDNGDGLGDVSQMVKGIGGPDSECQPMIHSSSRFRAASATI